MWPPLGQAVLPWTHPLLDCHERPPLPHLASFTEAATAMAPAPLTKQSLWVSFPFVPGNEWTTPTTAIASPPNQ